MSEAAGGRVLGHVPGVHDGEGALVGPCARVHLAGTAAAAAGGVAGGVEAGAGSGWWLVVLVLFLAAVVYRFDIFFSCFWLHSTGARDRERESKGEKKTRPTLYSHYCPQQEKAHSR